MTSELKVDKITPASGTNTQIGEAGDTTNLSAGTVTLPTSIITGATEKTSMHLNTYRNLTCLVVKWFYYSLLLHKQTQAQ